MMTKSQLRNRDEILDDLRGAQAKIEEGLAVYGSVVGAALDKLNDLVIEYNQVVERAQNFRDDIVSQLEETIDGKSEKWLETDRGEATVQLKDEWESLDLEEISTFDTQDDFSFESTHAEDLEELSTEVEV